MSDPILNKKLRQVQALLDRAEHPNTPPDEALSARVMAEQFMDKYKIDEESARLNAMAQNIDTIKPIIDEFPVCNFDSEYRNHYASLMSWVADFVGNIRCATRYSDGNYVFTMVGFESDVKHAQTMYTSLRLHFANTLEPTVDPSLSEKENVYRLRTAGIERHRIGKMLWGPDGGKKHLKVGQLYKEACADRGEDPTVSGRSVNAKTYRKSFADGYVSQISRRLWQARELAETGVGLQLAGRKEAVDEAFYTKYPQFRPITDEGRMLGEGTQGGPGGNCKKCNKAAKGYCRDHMWMKPSTALHRGSPTSYAGSRAGRSAANSADIGGTGGRRIES